MNSYKNKYLFIGFFLILSVVVFVGINKEVSILQGVNGEVHEIRMPLYMKLLDFWTRQNHYQLLVEKLLKGKSTNREKLNALFQWTAKNIRPIPSGFPIYDDHVDNIIIRRYGTDDQSADVFTTLAVFAGFDAGIYLLKSKESAVIHAISVVEESGRILVYDTYCNFFFLNNEGEVASLDEIRNDISLVTKVAKGYKLNGHHNYVTYFKDLKPLKKIGWSKADLQIFSKRITYLFGRAVGLLGTARTFYGAQYK